MTTQPPAASFRGAVDLTALGGAAAPAVGAAATSGGGRPGAGPVTDATFAQLLQSLMDVPVLVVLWSGRDQTSRDYVAQVVELAKKKEGRIAVLDADVDANPGIYQAFQPRSVPHVSAVLAGQPAPLWEGAQPASAVEPVLDKLTEVALAEGLTGRVTFTDAPVSDAAEEAADEAPLPEHIERAYEAVERDDLDGARGILRAALEANPKDDESRLMLAQLELMARTRGVDLEVARAAAAQNPDDIEAQLTVADLDVLGGHVEDAFSRLVALVKRLGGEERNTVREHLVMLFDVVGAEDPRVEKGRRALMSALF